MEEEKICYFRSEFIHDLPLQKEFNKGAVWGKKLNRALSMTVAIILAVFYILMVFLLDAPGKYSGGVLKISAFYLVIEAIRLLTLRGGGITFKRMLYANGGQPPRCDVRFLEDCIQNLNASKDVQSTFQYDQIKSVTETENLYLLGMKYQMYLIVDKRTLTGSGDFSAFLLPRMKKKKVISARKGRIIERIKWIVVAFSILLGILHHPALQLKERLSGQIHNGMACSEIAAELESFGITGIDEEMLETYDAIYRSALWADGSKLKMLLYTMGMGEYDMETQDWTPPEGGVSFFSYSAVTMDGMYTSLLSDLSSMTGGELSITDILEEPFDNGSRIRITFLLNGEAQTMEADNFGEWYDESILNTLNELLAGTGKQLYFATNDDYSCFIFYADTQWAQAFSDRTGLELATDIYEIY